MVSNQTWQQLGQTTSTNDWPWGGICHVKTDRSHLFLECVNGEALTMCSKPLIAEGAWPRQIWGGEICGGFYGGILSLRAKGFWWWTNSASKSLCSGFGVLKNVKLPQISGSGISTFLFLLFRHSCPLRFTLTKPHRYGSQAGFGNVFSLP